MITVGWKCAEESEDGRVKKERFTPLGTGMGGPWERYEAPHIDSSGLEGFAVKVLSNMVDQQSTPFNPPIPVRGRQPFLCSHPFSASGLHPALPVQCSFSSIGPYPAARSMPSSIMRVISRACTCMQGGSEKSKEGAASHTRIACTCMQRRGERQGGGAYQPCLCICMQVEGREAHHHHHQRLSHL